MTLSKVKYKIPCVSYIEGILNRRYQELEKIKARNSVPSHVYSKTIENSNMTGDLNLL